MNATTATIGVTPDGTEYTDDYLVFGEEIEIRIELITPERAREFLAHNERNRNLKLPSIKLLVEAMSEGHWMFNGDPIRVDRDGRLIDGQHRLLACVESQRPFTALVITGLPPETQDTIDLGKKRSVSDALSMKGYSNTTVLAGGLVLLNSWVRFGLVNRGGGRSVVTPARALDLLRRFPDFPDQVRQRKTSRLSRLSAPSGWVVTGYILDNIDVEESAMFFHGIETGENLPPGDPRLTLRRRFEKIKEQGGGNSTVSQAAQVWMILRAWQAFSRRETISKLQLPPSLGTADVWPSLPGDKLRRCLAEEGE